MYWGSGWNDAGGWMMGIGMIAVVALIAVGVYLLVRATSGQRQQFAGPTGEAQSAFRNSGLDVLDDRYARGEIERDEYLARRQDLVSPR